MDPDWAELARVLLPPPGGSSLPTAVAMVAFDTNQELLWAGNEYGRVNSFYGAELGRYTSFKAHPATEGPVRQILFTDKGVIALGSKNVHMALRRGVTLWNIRDEVMHDMRCMSFTSRGTAEIIVAGMQDTMVVIDVNKREITKRLPTEHRYTIMKNNSRYICAATDDGSVDILDPISFKVLRTWNAHSTFINDMDVRADFIVTCGASLKQQAAMNYMFDPYVNVFDLKNMTSMSPVAFPPLAAYVRMHPRMVTTAIVVSQQGQMHIIDLMNPNTSNVRQANILSYVTGIEIAPTGEALALTDTECSVHLWGSPSRVQFTEIPGQLEMQTSEEIPPHIDWTPETPLNSVGMPFYNDTLASVLPDVICDVGAPPVKFDGGYLSTLQKTEYGLYGRANPRFRRNQIENTRDADKSASIQAPKFLSEKSRESAHASSSSGASGPNADEFTDPLALTELESMMPEAPSMYRTVEIKFSKFGVDDFDFGFYNRTRYAGLENHIANSYANCLLQVLHYTPLIRNLALQHAASACLHPQCLLCELGYVFDMLQKAEGSTCQATNMLKILSSHQQAKSLRLIEDEIKKNPLGDMIQQLTRFLLDQIARDYQRILPGSPDMEQALGTSSVTSMRCTNCRTETTRRSLTYVNELKYPTQPQARGGKATKITFSQVLKQSIEKDATNKGWCGRCQRYQSLSTRKQISSLPSVLVLNAAYSAAAAALAPAQQQQQQQQQPQQQQQQQQGQQAPEFKRWWATPGWLPEEIGIIVDPAGQFFCYEGEDLKLHLQRGIHNITVYSLVGMAVNIESGHPQAQKSHLVSLVNVAHAEPAAPESSQWHLFNDFLVRPVSNKEALAFNTAWKTPAVIAFQLKSANNKIDADWKNHLDTSVLYMDTKPESADKTYRVFDEKTERPGPDTIVALDTEFVAIRQPEIEMNSDGIRETIRPMTHALARVSVVRGQGEDEGLPFIDDYIVIQEPIVDYLTAFSGISQGDLDPRSSPHSLVPLKTAYKKLWVLLNLGCKFLGHGLKQDFRVINIRVPRAQVVDTIDLFFLRARLRRLSLAFLAWFLLKEDIQLDTHDSIEDARTALKLYRKYLEFEDAGILETMLQDIYRAGRDTGFKPPARVVVAAATGKGGGEGEGEGEVLVVVKRSDTPPVAIEGLAGPSTPNRFGGPVGLAGGGGGGGPSAAPPGFGASGPVTPGGTTTPGGGGGFGALQGWTPGKGSSFR